MPCEDIFTPADKMDQLPGSRKRFSLYITALMNSLLSYLAFQKGIRPMSK